MISNEFLRLISLGRYVCGSARKFIAPDKSQVDSISMSCQWNKTWTPGSSSQSHLLRDKDKDNMTYLWKKMKLQVFRDPPFSHDYSIMKINTITIISVNHKKDQLCTFGCAKNNQRTIICH